MSLHPAYPSQGSLHTVQGLVVSAFDAHTHARSLRLLTSYGIQSAWLRNGIIPFQVALGQVWNFTGEIVDLKQYGEQLEIRQAVPAMPAPPLLVPFLAHSVPGLSRQRARRMQDALGNGLVAAMEHGAIAALEHALGRPAPSKIAAMVVRIWADQAAYTELVQELYKYGITEQALRNAVSQYGQRSLEQVRDDPYRLLAFTKLGPVDQAALEHFGVPEDDKRRLMGTVDAAVYALHDQGRSIFTQSQLQEGICELGTLRRDQIVEAIKLAVQHSRLVAASEHQMMGDGFAQIERVVTQFLVLCNRSQSGSTAAPSLMHTGDASTVPEAASGAAAAKISIILANEESLAFKFVKCVADLFDSRNEPCYVMAGSDALRQRINVATGLQTKTLHRAITDGLGKPREVSSPRAIAIVSSTIDFVDMARLLPLLDPADRLLFIGKPLLYSGDRTLLLPALMSVDQIFCRKLSSNANTELATDAASSCAPSMSATKIAYSPRESDRSGVFWIYVATDAFERAVAGVSQQLRKHGSVAIIVRDCNEQRHYAKLITEAMIEANAPGYGTVSVATADGMEPCDSDSTVVLLRQPMSYSTPWFEASVSIAASRTIIITTVESDFKFSTMQDDDSALRGFVTRWRRLSTEKLRSRDEETCQDNL